MSYIHIVTDSTAYLTKDFINKANITVVPLSVDFCGQTSHEGFPGEFEEFFEKIKDSNEFPTTSQPSAGAFAEAFKRAVEKDGEVIAIVISSKLSGTYNSAQIAANMTGADKISVIDSETSASNLRMLVERAVELANEDRTRSEIEEVINVEKKKMGINLTVATLDYLKKGGRLTRSQAMIGSLLNIKPIIALINGELVPVEKVRGKSKAIEAMISNIPENVGKISVCHVVNIEEASELRSILEKKFKHAEVGIDELGPVIGAHLGPKAIGICFKW